MGTVAASGGVLASVGAREWEGILVAEVDGAWATTSLAKESQCSDKSAIFSVCPSLEC